MTITTIPKPASTISGTVATSDIQQESYFHEIAKELKKIRQHQEVMTGIEFTEEIKE